MQGDNFSRSVFVNCPFDKRYQRLFDAIVFAIAFCGFDVRSALEDADSGDLRLLKIVRLIRESKFSIHDISRVEPDKSSGLPRFNMPLELGAAIGMRHSGSEVMADHRVLILDAHKFRYQKFVSDLAGVDIKEHNNRPLKVIRSIRDFFNPIVSDHLPSPSVINEHYQLFEKSLPELAKAKMQKMSELTYIDRLRHLNAYLERHFEGI